MRKALIALFAVHSIIAGAQDMVGLSFSQNFSTFRFVNSAGNLADLAYTFKYGYGVSYQKDFLKHFSAEGFLAYNYKGANSTAEHELVDWQFHYMNAGVNGIVRFFSGKARPYAGAGLYYGYLVRADQFFGETYFNLISEGNIRRNDLGVNILAGLVYSYSDFGSVCLRVNEALGLYQLEDPEISSQKLFNRTFSIQVGLLFVIKSAPGS